MQPKPIDSRRLLDIDLQKRTVDMEGMQHLRSVSGHKEHPAETDYDIVHEEEGRRNRERAAEQFSEHLKKIRAKNQKKSEHPAGHEAPNEPHISQNGKGSHLDVEA
jgi:hypothetical protein